MSLIEKTYRHDIDILKGMAIIAIVLYHAGWCKSGYLGVDVFLVLNGFLVVPKVMNEIEEGRFRYFVFLEKKIFRLLPLVLLVSGLSLAIGYWGMLPHDYRFLSEEAVAASVFMNNILQAITTQNYWAAIYQKVLMHTWFLGVLFQFYLVFPLLMLLMKRQVKVTLMVLTVLSIVLYLLPIDSIGNKYYMLPYRFFEIAIGGLVAIKPIKVSAPIKYISLCGLLFMIFLGAFTIGERTVPYNLVGGSNTIRESFLPREVMVLLTVLFAVLSCLHDRTEDIWFAFARQSKFVAPLGRMSLSVFLWHQPLFAFYRYFFADELSPAILCCLIGIALLLSFSTYSLFEKRITINKMSRIYLIFSFIIVNVFALWIYQKGGIVRDIPELDIQEGVTDPKIFEHYTDRIYQYDHEFSHDNSKKKILVIGNSFARDFANILLESPMRDSVQLSYHYAFIDCPITRIRQCNRLYFFGWRHDVPDSVWRNLKQSTEVWGIGTKNHGTSNGIFYKKRHCLDYFNQRVSIREDFHRVNAMLHDEWQEKYVDFLSLTLDSDGAVPVFNSNHKFITYDGRHLTPAGVSFYQTLLFKEIYVKE
jgi:peptidoglycan/LPS O-acetylase OafA/YrhL